MQTGLNGEGHGLISSDDESGTQNRNYTLNYSKAMRKKAEACGAAYKVLAEVKNGYHIFKFSTAMYEI